MIDFQAAKEKIEKYSRLPLNKTTFRKLAGIPDLEKLLDSPNLPKSRKKRPSHPDTYSNMDRKRGQHDYRTEMLNYISQWIDIGKSPEEYTSSVYETLADICQSKSSK